MAETFTQDDIRFINPPPGAIGLNPITAKEYLPNKGQLIVLSQKGAEPHTIEGKNFRIHVGRKPAGRHQVAILSSAEPLVVRYKKDEMILDSGVYYIVLANGGGNVPVFQN